MEILKMSSPSPRIFNGFSETINVTSGEHDFGYSVPNNMSEYRMLHSGQ